MAQHPDDAAVDAPVTYEDDESAAAALMNHLDEDEETEGEEPTEDEDSEPETDEDAETDEDEEEADEEGEDEEDGEDEPESPAIDPPASLTAEEKAQWAQLPQEAQQFAKAFASRRDSEVQQGLEKARTAQQESERTAAGRVAEAERLHAEQLAQIASAYAPREPDHRLIDQNPQAYMAQKARYDAAKAQHDEFMQQVQAFHHGATQQQEQLEQQAMQQMWADVKAELPEAADPQQWTELMSNLTPLAVELGYPKELLPDANPQDIRAIKRASEWKAKADKWDALQTRKMSKVRSAKGKSAKPNAAQPLGSGKARAKAKAQARLKQTGSDADALAVFDAMNL